MHHKKYQILWKTTQEIKTQSQNQTEREKKNLLSRDAECGGNKLVGSYL